MAVKVKIIGVAEAVMLSDGKSFTTQLDGGLNVYDVEHAGSGEPIATFAARTWRWAQVVDAPN